MMDLPGSFDGRDLFGFDAAGSQFDSDFGTHYDISADFAAPDDQAFSSFGMLDSFSPQAFDETELVSLTFQGYVFAKRIVTIKRSSDPLYPLPFFFREDMAKHVFLAGTCTVLQDPLSYNSILCVPFCSDTNGSGGSQEMKRQKLTGSTEVPPTMSADGITELSLWEVLGIFRDDNTQAMTEVVTNRDDVLRLLLNVFTDMPQNARTYFSTLLATNKPVVIKQESDATFSSPAASQQEQAQRVLQEQSAVSAAPKVSCVPPTPLYMASAVVEGDMLHPVEQKVIEVLDLATNLWKDLTESDHEQQMSWSVFVERFCGNPCNIMQTTPSVVSSLHALFCQGNSSTVTLESWQKFVCMFWVAQPSDTFVVYNWAEADSLLDQPWFCGMLGKAGAQGALSRSDRTCSEFLVRCSESFWRYGVFVLSKSFPEQDVVHTRIARHRPGESEYLTLTRAGTVRFSDLTDSQFVYAMTGERARKADMFYYSVPFVDNPKPTRTVWPTLNALVADLNEHYKARGYPFPLVPSKGVTPYND